MNLQIFIPQSFSRLCLFLLLQEAFKLSLYRIFCSRSHMLQSLSLKMWNPLEAIYSKLLHLQMKKQRFFSPGNAYPSVYKQQRWNSLVIRARTKTRVKISRLLVLCLLSYSYLMSATSHFYLVLRVSTSNYYHLWGSYALPTTSDNSPLGSAWKKSVLPKDLKIAAWFLPKAYSFI